MLTGSASADLRSLYLCLRVSPNLIKNPIFKKRRDESLTTIKLDSRFDTLEM